ncbi:MAG: ASCH domain-containing protein [Phycisphaeraceae bacterium]
MIHVAILKPGYIQAVLAGRKTIESRLTRTKQPPYGKVMPGERLYLKASGGPFMATAIAGKVRSFADMSPEDVLKLRKRYGKAIDGDDAYWDMKRDSKYATLIELKNTEQITLGPPYKVAYMKAWYVLEEDRDPLRIARLLH